MQFENTYDTEEQAEYAKAYFERHGFTVNVEGRTVTCEMGFFA